MVTLRIDELVGRVLGDRYRLTQPLGVGASANVYVGEDTKLRRRVAVKMLHPALAGETAFLRRFEAEARNVAGLRHPNILRLYDSGRDEAGPYLVMELLEGGSLRSILDQGSLLSPGQAAAVGADTAKALAYAHRQGVVHRDIKPANLIFDDEGRVYIADFGLARALAEAALTEPTGAVVGTGRYAAPETLGGGPLDAKADVYSLALVLSEAVSGTVPLVADTPLGTLALRAGRDLPAPESAGPLSSALESAGRCQPAERVAAAEFAKALDDVGSRLPRPAPLALRSLGDSEVLAGEPVDPTELPGRPVLFDIGRQVEADMAGPSRAAASTVPVGTPPQGPAEPDDSASPAGSDELRGSADDPSEPMSQEAKRGRRTWKIAAVVVAVLMLLGGGGLAWAAVTGKFLPASHPVPVLVGDSRVQAFGALSRLHLKLDVASSTYNPRYQSGLVISQTPASGKIREGQTVSVVLSLGPEPVKVPVVQGDTVQAAEQALQALGLGFKLAAGATSMTVPAGEVISATPSSGTLLPGQSVTIVVSLGKPKVAVPSLASNAAFAAVSAAIDAAGLSASQVSDYSTTVPKGDVISVNPSPGTTITVGDNVTVDVSLGPHDVAVPQVAGDSVGAAVQALSADGLGVAGTNGNPINSVTSTLPAAGSEVLYGSSVTLVTG